MIERRQSVRTRARLMVRYLVLPDGPTTPTATHDVSCDGVCCLTGRSLERGTSLQMALALPGSEAPIPFIGHVVWSDAYEVTSAAGSARGAQTGIRIAEIAPNDRATISAFIRGQPLI